MNHHASKKLQKGSPKMQNCVPLVINMFPGTVLERYCDADRIFDVFLSILGSRREPKNELKSVIALSFFQLRAERVESGVQGMPKASRMMPKCLQKRCQRPPTYVHDMSIFTKNDRMDPKI